jgi:hypothetical protein
MKWLSVLLWGALVIACLGTLNTLFPSVYQFATATLSVAIPLHIGGVMIGSRSMRGMLFFLVLLALLALQISLSTQIRCFVLHPCAAVYLVWSASFAAGVVLGHLCRTRD